MIKGSIIKGKHIPENLERAIPRMESAVDKTVNRLAIKMMGMVKSKLSDDVLHVRSGRLRRSIHREIERSGSVVTAIIGTNVKYGKVHELGLTIPARSGVSKKGRKFNIPAIKMKKRSFLKASLDQMQPEIVNSLKLAVIRGLKDES